MGVMRCLLEHQENAGASRRRCQDLGHLTPIPSPPVSGTDLVARSTDGGLVRPDCQRIPFGSLIEKGRGRDQREVSLEK